MKNKLLRFLLSVMVILTACGEKPLEKDSITLYHATDMHYLSQQLTDNSDAFVEYIRQGDGKMVHYIEPIMEAFVADVINNKPDYVLVGGDITFNGEKLSHMDIVEKFRRMEENGTQVLVIPGNHDVDYPFCFGYKGTQMYSADRLLKEDYETVYADFGINQAYSRDEKSFSYFYRLTDKITLLALDTNTGGGTGVRATETLEWMEKELKKIKDGVKVVALTHQTLVDHFQGNSMGNQYSVINGQAVLDLFEKYGVEFNVSGHIHTQHKAISNNVTDVATESMAVLPCNYGVIEITPEKLTYSTQPVNVEAWAVQTGQTDENLLNFSDYSKEFYISSQAGLSASALAEENLTDEEKELMSNFFAELNIYYFSGTIDEKYDELSLSDGYKMWQERGKDLWHYKYIMQRMEEGNQQIEHDAAQILFE